jgi:ribosomal protein S18 acetylase RimI-like enzyme
MIDDRHINAIRPARLEDGPAILAMLAELASFEGAEHRPRLDASALARDVFGPNPKLTLFVAERTSEDELRPLVGFISYYENYSSWEGQAGIHIGDLWVAAADRGRGVGSSLLRHVLSRFKGRRIDVFVIRNNADARFVYERLGFKEQEQWCVYRIEGDGTSDGL